MKRSLPFAIILLTILACVVLTLVLSRRVGRNDTDAAMAASPAPVNYPTTGAEPARVKGAEGSPVTLEEFADFECPACAGFYPIMKSIEKEYGSRVRIVFREFPLAQHVHAMLAARAAEAAGMQGKFWQMHDLLYENRETWTKAQDIQVTLEDFAKRLGLDVERFKADLRSDLVRQRITLDHYRGRSMKLKSTPSLFLNGQELPYSEMKSVDDLRQAIDQALNKKQS